MAICYANRLMFRVCRQLHRNCTCIETRFKMSTYIIFWIINNWSLDMYPTIDFNHAQYHTLWVIRNCNESKPLLMHFYFIIPYILYILNLRHVYNVILHSFCILYWSPTVQLWLFLITLIILYLLDIIFCYVRVKIRWNDDNNLQITF